MVVGVLVEIQNKRVDKVFDYFVPNDLRNSIKVGLRVVVPFGRMELDGFIITIYENYSNKDSLKSIIEIIDSEIVLNDELLLLGKEMKKMTLSPLISCYQVMLPKALKAKHGKKMSIKYDTFYCLNPNKDIVVSSSSQQKIVDMLKEKKKIIRKDLLEISSSSLNTLLKNEIIIEEKMEHYRLNYSNYKFVKKELTSEQQKVVDEVISNDSNNYLLYGVTGSGKTEVYMEIIDFYLKRGKTCIVLVPEISLTPQMIQRFSERFGDMIAAIHSGLSDGEKYDEWRRIVRGEASIVIGARSAIFAPLQNIGVIIMDEEHSESYKQSDSNPRYHARDIAFLRAKKHHCSIIFGSATPSLESMARALKGVYKLLELPNRVNGRKLPHVDIIDMNIASKKMRGYFSFELKSAIEKCLSRNEQVILLLNRRGYSSFITCKNCGYTFKCPNCDISLTYHKSSNTLRCHYCGYGEKVYDKCPKCSEPSLNKLGVGTQKIEEELQDIFPNSKIIRMDYDTTSRKGMHEKMIEEFKNHQYDILLGTQMVAKGLDFSNVTLVGVINADTTLNIPDFRSSENTFSLLSQVSGRSGRSNKEGKVIIQTFNPDHYAIYYSSKYDYLSFYKKEMNIRKQLKYPPYFYLSIIRINGKDSNIVYQEALKIKRSLERNLEHVIILGPSVASIFRVNNIYRYQILLKYKNEEEIYSIIEKIINHYKNQSKVNVDVDFNPLQLL